MIKRIQFLFLILSTFAFFSCSNQVEKSASVNFSLSKNAARAITGEADGDWSLTISLSGGYSDEKIYQIREVSENSSQDAQLFILGDLPTGETVNVDVNIYNGEVRYFKSKETKSVTLAEGENSVDVVLERVRVNPEISIAGSGELAISASSSKISSEAEFPIIDYASEITYELKYKENSISISPCEWFLNGNKLDRTESSIKLTLAKSDYVNLSGTNTLTCNFTSGGNVFSVEFKFTTSDSTSTDTTE